ncbi:MULTISPECIES: CaiB/BaiF CoA transferase family protein [Pyramidobacter]|uniref:CoA-transferase family III protein n=2 Tax=Pyramidobacter piscolens TaxID=638849 RepID=A0ABP2HW21_9BACT|nr:MULTISPECIES: CoA transferase [Pyramidobacter]EFB91271.1 CoA-transferase family III protein [Pyramidobacter piscolens W5455]MDY3212550.1 CoA transferase [Pyramidobacter sp.]BDF78864.1 CoA transferase [Pyramidobacter piscolens]
MGALSNIRVLDLTRVLAGPYCTMMLADMGAEVIKIEIPGKGDDTRNFGPYKNKSSMYYANVNRNKKGVSLNMKAPEGKQLFLEMVKTADMVVENYRPGVMDKLGLGYDVLKEVNPRIIYGAVSGFGCYGPYSERPGYDIIAQAMGGLMSITGPRGGKPCRSGSAMGDVLGGMNLTIGLLAALNARSITGKGQRVDVALVDSVVSSLETGIQRYLVNHEIPERMGNEYAATYPYDSFKAKDKEFIIGCGNQGLFEKLLDLMGRKDLLEDSRFATLLERNKPENRIALGEIINDWTKNYNADELVDKILGVGVPAAPIFDLHDVTTDEHLVKAREMLVDLPHPVIGPMQVNGNPVKLMGTPVEITRHAPVVPGADNAEVYGGIFGLSGERLRELSEKGVI